VFKWISLKREKPLNYGEFKTPIGVVETMKEGADITLVSYGSTLIEQAAQELLERVLTVRLMYSLFHSDINHDLVKVLPNKSTTSNR
jgi:transketolase C-terminal domain/subunit